MSVQKALEGRFSCRKFAETPLPRTVINDLLKTVQKTASWCNTQPWAIDVISGESLKKLSDSLIQSASSGNVPNPDFDFPEQYSGVFRERRKVCGLQIFSVRHMHCSFQLLKSLAFMGRSTADFIFPLLCF